MIPFHLGVLSKIFSIYKCETIPMLRRSRHFGKMLAILARFVVNLNEPHIAVSCIYFSLFIKK